MVKFVSAYGSGFVYSTFCVPLYVGKGCGTVTRCRQQLNEGAAQQNGQW